MTIGERTARGYDAYEVVSALQKAIRRSDPDAALYWGFELARSGRGSWLWKRLRIIAVEDCSPVATGLVSDIYTLNQQWIAAQKGRNDGHEELYVARALISLATAEKNRVTDWAVWHHTSDHVDRREIPDEALDKHTRRGRKMGRKRQHFLDEAALIVPWKGTFAVLEAEYLAKAQLRVDIEEHGEIASFPDNPWARSAVGATNSTLHASARPPDQRGTKPAQYSQKGSSGQLPLGGEG